MVIETITIPMRFKTKPVLAIWMTVILLLPKIVAFGGVATGSIKANDPAMVTGSINNSGLVSLLTASPSRIGNRVSTVTILEVISVKKVIKKQIHKMRSNGCMSLNHSNCCRNHNDYPETLKPLAKAKPPPNNNIISHGISSAAFQSIKKLPGCAFEGMIKRSTAIKMATVPSLKNWGSLKILDQPGILNDPTKMHL